MFSVTMNSHDRRIPSVATPRREKNSSMLEMSERRKSNARGWSCSTDWETSMMYRWLSCNLKHAGVSIHIPGTGDGGKEGEDRVLLTECCIHSNRHGRGGSAGTFFGSQ